MHLPTIPPSLRYNDWFLVCVHSYLLQDNSSRGPLVLDVAVPRYLDTSAIDVDIHPTWIQCIIKGKNLLLHFDCEIDVTNSKVQRVLANGHLVVTMPRLSASTSSGVVRGVLGEEVAAAPAATTSTSTTSSYSSAADSLKYVLVVVNTCVYVDRLRP